MKTIKIKSDSAADYNFVIDKDSRFDAIVVNNAVSILKELIENGNTSKDALFAWFNGEFDSIISTLEDLCDFEVELQNEAMDQSIHYLGCGTDTNTDCFRGKDCRCWCHKSQ